MSDFPEEMKSEIFAFNPVPLYIQTHNFLTTGDRTPPDFVDFQDPTPERYITH